MITGQTYQVSITMSNPQVSGFGPVQTCGIPSWRWSEACGDRLGSQNPQDNIIWGNNRQYLARNEIINEGQNKTFTFNVTAPSTSGVYNFQWQMVQEGGRWFGEKTPNVAVKVNYPNTTQVCSPNQVSGCKVCKADGSAWQDDNSKCPTGQTCQNGTCVAGCANECSTSGAKQCSGTAGYKTCGNYDNDSCLEWSSVTNCSSGQTCSGDGICISTCTPKTCTQLGYTCGTAADGCGGTLNCGSCPSGQTCLNNKCTTCTNACTSGTSQCNGTTGYQTCGDTNGDGCTEWGAVIACGANQTCKDGHCSVSCVSHAEQKCDIGNLYWYDSCGNKEELAQDCGTDEFTVNYRCSNDKVQQYKLLYGCENNACTASDTWVDIEDCLSQGKICQNGKCVASSIVPIITKPVNQMSKSEILAAITQMQQMIADLTKQLQSLTGNPTIINQYSCTQLTKNLFYNYQNDSAQVKCLQEFLQKQGYAIIPSGSYDLSTKNAVKAFQEKYASEILNPYNLRYGSGNVGNNTREKINRLIQGHN